MKKVKKLYIVLIVIFYFLLLISCSSFNQLMKGKIINIGVVIPLSGNIGYFGQQAKEGIELAYLISNKNNPKIKVKLIFKDDMADAAVSRELCEELITKENLFNNKISVNI